jgi:translation initiation factor 1
MSTKSGSPFAALEALRGKVPEGQPVREPVPSQAKIAKGPARAVVRLERKQRRGKEVTVVEKLGLPDAQLTQWCRELKQALGCGGAVENDTIVLQGDLRKRLPDVLTSKGVGKITLG